MTRDEVMAMTDDELRVKAAELMGWRFIGVLPVPGSLGESSYRAWEGEYGIVATIESDQPNLTKDNYLPDYPNDIAAAWGLVEHNPDWRWAVYELDGGGWAATPMKVIGTRGEHCLWDHVSEATEDTAPRAITRAFILGMDAA